jgi:putative tryptophan/tyrosine transport system substrate-binding protein
MNAIQRFFSAHHSPHMWLAAIIACATLGATALAEESRKLPKIGELWFQDQHRATYYQVPFRNTLRDLGYVDGKTAIFVTRYADGDTTKVPALLAELLAQKLDVLWITPMALPAAKQARTTTPIVSIFVDPIAEGVAKSLARPSGNITGMSWQTAESSGKRLQYTTELLPNLSRVALLYDSGDPAAALDARALREAAKALKLQMNELEFHNAKQLDSAFATIKHDRPQAIVVVHSPLSVHHRDDIVRRAAEARIPFVSEGRDFADAGALLSFGPSVIDMFKRSALYVQRILKGAKPADLPIEQPTVFELVINQKTAKALGIKIPEAILLRADEVIK